MPSIKRADTEATEPPRYHDGYENPLDEDANEVLRAIAREYPEFADLSVEACVLSFSALRMESAMQRLAEAGLASVDGSNEWASLPGLRARITEKGIAAIARMTGLRLESSGRLGRRSAAMPVGLDRRHEDHDRRLVSGKPLRR
jgi:hypothetical protein